MPDITPQDQRKNFIGDVVRIAQVRQAQPKGDEDQESKWDEFKNFPHSISGTLRNAPHLI